MSGVHVITGMENRRESHQLINEMHDWECVFLADNQILETKTDHVLLLLIWFNFNFSAWISNYIYYKVSDEITLAAPLTFDNW